MNTITKAKKTKYNANLNTACNICQAVLSITPILNTGPPGIAVAAVGTVGYAMYKKRKGRVSKKSKKKSRKKSRKKYLEKKLFIYVQVVRVSQWQL